MTTKEGSTKIVNLNNPRSMVLVVGRGNINSYNENTLFLQKSSSLLPGIDQTKQVFRNDDQGRLYQNCKLHDV